MLISATVNVVSVFSCPYGDSSTGLSQAVVQNTFTIKMELQQQICTQILPNSIPEKEGSKLD